MLRAWKYNFLYFFVKSLTLHFRDIFICEYHIFQLFFQCITYSDCCRHLDCLFYAHKCVSRPGPPDPNDKRPVGPN